MPDRDLVAGVVQLANLFTRRLVPVFERSGVTPQQWAVLAVIGAAEAPMTLAAAARELLVSKQNMTGMIARLEQLGLAERSGDPNDLRSARVQLTRKGRTLLDKTRPGYEEWIAKLAGGTITERDLQALTRTVNKLIASIEEP